MATETRYIYSRHTPETAEQSNIDDSVDPWLTEQPFGVNERIARPPRFVAASASTDSTQTTPSDKLVSSSRKSWYLSLKRTSTSGSSTPLSGSSASPEIARPNALVEQPPRKAKKPDELWFIRQALDTQASEQSEASGSGSSTPTLADILTRDPPPLPSEKQYKPPVWLVVGPGNKGFEMLQKSGWEEGEALGLATRRSAGLGFKPKVPPPAVKEDLDADEVIDLTHSSDDDDDDGDTDEAPESRSTMTNDATGQPLDYLDHHPVALVTPIPITLKSDRLGIGLKAKTVGPFRESVKKVTHSQAAMAAHARASEKMRRQKQVLGRGRRGFEKIKRAEERSRKSMLAYLNAG
ncbi:hypothetical protein SCHPADRAFT_238530 [Schizopora paradoxa]|uniref:G-patch domain-containing protein n=1 Tax=Schizopora paradoxa TaxID=27342 RepID=A0A0H2RVF2_9AGAM|nr:hypothetical protein SCHPADRAFT_238530 [Schizopora paradoxa]